MFRVVESNGLKIEVKTIVTLPSYSKAVKIAIGLHNSTGKQYMVKKGN